MHGVIRWRPKLPRQGGLSLSAHQNNRIIQRRRDRTHNRPHETLVDTPRRDQASPPLSNREGRDLDLGRSLAQVV